MGCFSGSESESKSTSYLPAQKKYMTKAVELYGPELGRGQVSYPGERLAAFSPEQQAALNQIGSYLDSFSAGTETPLFAQTGRSLTDILTGAAGAGPISPEQTTDYFRSVYEQPARKEYAENILPATREAYAGPGYWSGARAGAETKSAQDLGQWLGAQRGALEWNVADVNRQLAEAKASRMLSAAPLAMQYGQIPLQEAITKAGATTDVFSALGAERAQKQAEINVAIQKWAESQNITDPQNLGILMDLLGMTYQRSTGISSGPGLGYAGTSAFMAGLGSAMGIPKTT